MLRWPWIPIEYDNRLLNKCRRFYVPRWSALTVHSWMQSGTTVESIAISFQNQFDVRKQANLHWWKSYGPPITSIEESQHSTTYQDKCSVKYRDGHDVLSRNNSEIIEKPDLSCHAELHSLITVPQTAVQSCTNVKPMNWTFYSRGQ